MTRTRDGANGEVAMRMNDRIMMTVRPEPMVLDDTDIAMLLGSKLDITDGYSNYTPEEAIKKIWDWEYGGLHPVKLTQKVCLNMINDVYLLAQFQHYTDQIDQFDDANPTHRVLLQLVHRVWPKFTLIEEGGEE